MELFCTETIDCLQQLQELPPMELLCAEKTYCLRFASPAEADLRLGD